MLNRPLGKTGLSVSILGLGTVKLGRTAGVKYPAAFEIPGDDAAARLLALAAERGINVIDTAPAYGNSEERLGALLPGQRDRWCIITKAGEEFEGGHSRFDFSPGAVRQSVERSLRRLRTDRVEVLLLHSDGKVEHEVDSELWTELQRMKSAGKVRAIGISSKTPQGARACLPHCDVLMLTLNAADRGDEPVVAEAIATGVGVVIKKPLASGHSADPAEQLRLIASTPGVTTAIVGTINPDHLRANCEAVASVR